MKVELKIIAALIERLAETEEDHLLKVRELMDTIQTGKQTSLRLTGGCSVFARLFESKLEVFCHEDSRLNCPKYKALSNALNRYF